MGQVMYSSVIVVVSVGGSGSIAVLNKDTLFKLVVLQGCHVGERQPSYNPRHCVRIAAQIVVVGQGFPVRVHHALHAVPGVVYVFGVIGGGHGIAGGKDKGTGFVDDIAQGVVLAGYRARLVVDLLDPGGNVTEGRPSLCDSPIGVSYVIACKVRVVDLLQTVEVIEIGDGLALGYQVGRGFGNHVRSQVIHHGNRSCVRIGDAGPSPEIIVGDRSLVVVVVLNQSNLFQRVVGIFRCYDIVLWVLVVGGEFHHAGDEFPHVPEGFLLLPVGVGHGGGEAVPQDAIVDCAGSLIRNCRQSVPVKNVVSHGGWDGAGVKVRGIEHGV